MSEKKPRFKKDRRSEEEKLEQYIRERAAVRGISVEEYKELIRRREAIEQVRKENENETKEGQHVDAPLGPRSS